MSNRRQIAEHNNKIRRKINAENNQSLNKSLILSDPKRIRRKSVKKTGPDSASVIISAIGAVTEVDSDGDIKNIVTPWDVPRILNDIQSQVRKIHPSTMDGIRRLLQFVGKGWVGSKYSGGGWIGSHVHLLEDWVKGNEDPTVNLWGICNGISTFGGDCNTTGIGFCGEWCGGGTCTTVPEIVDPGSGMTVSPSSKTYSVQLTVWI